MDKVEGLSKHLMEENTHLRKQLESFRLQEYAGVDIIDFQIIQKKVNAYPETGAQGTRGRASAGRSPYPTVLDEGIFFRVIKKF